MKITGRERGCGRWRAGCQVQVLLRRRCFREQCSGSRWAGEGLRGSLTWPDCPFLPRKKTGPAKEKGTARALGRRSRGRSACFESMGRMVKAPFPVQLQESLIKKREARL